MLYSAKIHVLRHFQSLRNKDNERSPFKIKLYFITQEKHVIQHYVYIPSAMQNSTRLV